MYNLEFNITVNGLLFDWIRYSLNTADLFSSNKEFTASNDESISYKKTLNFIAR